MRSVAQKTQATVPLQTTEESTPPQSSQITTTAEATTTTTTTAPPFCCDAFGDRFRVESCDCGGSDALQDQDETLCTLELAETLTTTAATAAAAAATTQVTQLLSMVDGHVIWQEFCTVPQHSQSSQIACVKEYQVDSSSPYYSCGGTWNGQDCGSCQWQDSLVGATTAEQPTTLPGYAVQGCPTSDHVENNNHKDNNGNAFVMYFDDDQHDDPKEQQQEALSNVPHWLIFPGTTDSSSPSTIAIAEESPSASPKGAPIVEDPVDADTSDAWLVSLWLIVGVIFLCCVLGRQCGCWCCPRCYPSNVCSTSNKRRSHYKTVVLGDSSSGSNNNSHGANDDGDTDSESSSQSPPQQEAEIVFL